MKRILIIFVAVILAACSAVPAPVVQPTAAPPEPTQTAVVVVETVVVTVVPTNPPAEAPSATPLPPPTEAPATQPPAATEAVAAPAEASGGPISIDDVLGAGWFVSMTRDRNDFSLRCQLNKQITFSVKATDPNITQVDFWYRFEDRSNGAIFEWVNAGRMIPDGQGNFILKLSGDQVNPNFRKPNSWFDYQFVGYNATGVVGRSEKIDRQVTYTFDCP